MEDLTLRVRARTAGFPVPPPFFLWCDSDQIPCRQTGGLGSHRGKGSGLSHQRASLGIPVRSRKDPSPRAPDHRIRTPPCRARPRCALDLSDRGVAFFPPRWVPRSMLPGATRGLRPGRRQARRRPWWLATVAVWGVFVPSPAGLQCAPWGVGLALGALAILLFERRFEPAVGARTVPFFRLVGSRASLLMGRVLRGRMGIRIHPLVPLGEGLALERLFVACEAPLIQKPVQEGRGSVGWVCVSWTARAGPSHTHSKENRATDS